MLSFIHIPKNAGTSIKKIIQKNHLPIKYLDHYVINYPPEYFIILRDPIDRFCSAVNYAMSYYAHLSNIQELYKCNIITPEQWVQALISINTKKHLLILNEICNNNTSKHSINKCLIPFKFTYSAQSLWIKNNPKYILLFDNVDEEINKLFIKLFNKNISVLHDNASKHTDDQLSSESIEFLHNFYREDCERYNFYRNTKFDRRISAE